MNRFKNVLLFFKLNRRDALLFIEAYVYLGWARLLLLFPFAKISPKLGQKASETSELHQREEAVLALKHISSAVNIMSRYTIWDSKCLVRAIAGLKMLARRRIDSTLYLGVARDETGQLIAHAWLRSGSFYVTGAEEMFRFTVVEKFAKVTRSL